jgi:ubiquinone biosynthesis monooxygenase Coq7
MELTAQVSPASDLGNRILKVNHAGEYGAISIYAGQIFMARLTARSMVGQLQEFQSHERRHLAIFGAELAQRGRRRCRSYYLCGFGGLVLGLVTGALGSAAIAATTVAVESVVLRHLKHQIEVLMGVDQAAIRAISAIAADEQLHHDQSADLSPPANFWSRVITPIVSGATEAVIWLGMKL